MKTKLTPYGRFTAVREAAGITGGHLSAWAVRQARQERPAVVDDLKRKQHQVPVVMSVGEIEAIHAARPRVKRWASPIATWQRSAHHGVVGEDCGKYSNKCTFKKIDHHPVAWSVCWITLTGRYMVYQYGPKQQVLRAPRGWKWAVDENGPHIVNTAGDADYHPTSLDLNTGGVRFCIEEARKNQSERKRQAILAKSTARATQQEAAMLAKYPAYACYVDSRKAGNCGVGTDSWMAKQAITNSHIPVDRLEKFKDERVQRVAATAVRRHLEELKNGMCLLLDHDADAYENAHANRYTSDNH